MAIRIPDMTLATIHRYNRSNRYETIHVIWLLGATVESEEFLRRMARQDFRVWDELMPKLRKIALGACHDLRVYDQLKDDIVQNVALKVFSHWQSFNGTSKLNTWIYAIARNCCIDELRRQGIHNEANPIVGEDGEEPVDGLLSFIADNTNSDMEQRLCVQQVLVELETEPPPRKGSMRKIDLLRWWVTNHPSTEELAEYLKTSLAAAKERKSYVLKALRELCHKYCGHEECAMSEGG